MRLPHYYESNLLALPQTVEETQALLESGDYLADRALATSVSLALNLGRPLFLEGEAGVGKTTFYKYFNGKDDLMVQAVQMRDDWEMMAWERAVKRCAGEDPLARLVGFFEVLDSWFQAPDFRGCLFINVASEFPNPNDPVHQAAAQYKKKGREGFLALAMDAGLVSAEDFADQYTLLLEGALIMRQVHGRDDAARIASRAVRRLVDEHLPA